MIRIFNFFRTYYKSILVLFIILFMSIASGQKIERVNWINIPHFDKIVHLLIYMIFSLVLAYDIQKSNANISLRRTILIVLFSVMLYGGIMELIQEYLIKTRSGDWLDFASDTIGIIFAVLLIILNRKGAQRVSQRRAKGRNI